MNMTSSTQTQLKEVQAEAKKIEKTDKKKNGADAPPASEGTGMLMTLLGYIAFAVATLLACYFAYDIRLYAIRTYGTVIHEFGAQERAAPPETRQSATRHQRVSSKTWIHQCRAPFPAMRPPPPRAHLRRENVARRASQHRAAA